MKPLHRNNENTDRLTMNIVENQDGVLVSLSGSVDIDSSPALGDQLLTLLRSRNTRMVSIDLSAVAEIDSSGFATLIEALKIARAAKTELRLQGLHDGLLRIVELTGLMSLFSGNNQAITHSDREVV
jgi:anti-sigma B factor antagonist